jgi:hypothetical protein
MYSQLSLKDLDIQLKKSDLSPIEKDILGYFINKKKIDLRVNAGINVNAVSAQRRFNPFRW